MRTKITLAIAVFIGLVLCSLAVAYMPALVIRECPHCKANVVQEDTLSGNTIGAKYYTDGKREAKMLPDHPALVKCPACSRLFWVEEAEEVDSGFDAAKGKQKVMAPSGQELLAYLSGATLPKDKEAYLRIHVWWAANDAWRWVPNSKPAFSKEQVKNLDALAALLDESEPGERILKAEVARELGRFDECLRLLSYQFGEDYDFVLSFIKSLAQDQVQGVRAFPRGK
jgi:endogenous inhibitor of DNA gyrase (YacG/DUF329 family)